MEFKNWHCGLVSAVNDTFLLSGSSWQYGIHFFDCDGPKKQGIAIKGT